MTTSGDGSVVGDSGNATRMLESNNRHVSAEEPILSPSSDFPLVACARRKATAVAGEIARAEEACACALSLASANRDAAIAAANEVFLETKAAILVAAQATRDLLAAELAVANTALRDAIDATSILAEVREWCGTCGHIAHYAPSLAAHATSFFEYENGAFANLNVSLFAGS